MSNFLKGPFCTINSSFREKSSHFVQQIAYERFGEKLLYKVRIWPARVSRECANVNINKKAKTRRNLKKSEQKFKRWSSSREERFQKLNPKEKTLFLRHVDHWQCQLQWGWSGWSPILGSWWGSERRLVQKLIWSNMDRKHQTLSP